MKYSLLSANVIGCVMKMKNRKQAEDHDLEWKSRIAIAFP